MHDYMHIWYVRSNVEFTRQTRFPRRRACTIRAKRQPNGKS
nr:MAG TPA: hypothetical protein [Caudoviricetes sp.]